MAILFKTQDPNILLKDFKKKIDDGIIQTWSYDQDGDFTHTPDQWKNKAWLKPKTENGSLVLSIINPKNQSISSLIYAVYHGRFVESMLLHCDSLFSNADISAYPSKNDKIS